VLTSLKALSCLRFSAFPSILALKFVISGFNTDIEFKGTVYHVQTEDKGPPSMVIMSLVYDRGTILASKRVGYQDLIEAGFDEKKLAERVSRQHKLICAAVKSGRIDELKEMTAKSAARRGSGAKAAANRPQPTAVPAFAANNAKLAEIAAANELSGGQQFDISLSDIVLPERGESEPVFEAVSIIEEEILPAEAVVVVSELSGKERPANNKLKLEILGESKFKGGERRTVNIMICRGTDRKVVAAAQIMIKVIGSAFRPVIFHASSDANGLAKVHLQLPQFSAGRAALLVRAIADGQEVEIRRLVTPGS
jgi:hypothetical protein